jgi:hypothetical protein
MAAICVSSLMRDLASAGISERLSANVFLMAGSCMLQKMGNTVWCHNINCTSSCHLIEVTKNEGGEYEEKDLGDGYDKDNPYKRKKGCFYICRCI